MDSGPQPPKPLTAADHSKMVSWMASVMLLDPGTATVDQFRDAFKTLCTKASTVTTPDAEKKNMWPRALEAHRALPPVEKKNLITLWGKGPLKAFEGFAGNAALAFKWPHFTRLKEGCVSTETRALHNHY